MTSRRDDKRSPEQIQRDFYAGHAAQYNAAHVDDGDEHQVALAYISAFVRGFNYESVLDVGAGTGRAVMHLADVCPSIRVRGIEPVAELIDQAIQAGVPERTIVEGTGTALPFDDDSFDVVCATAVMHHVPDPASVVAEMVRVANRAVFISDNNRFGMGRGAARWTKLAVHRSGLWPIAYRIKNRGKDHYYNEGDGGVAYSYSVYDSVPLVNAWADRTFVIPTVKADTSLGHPMMSATHGLLCGFREG